MPINQIQKTDSEAPHGLAASTCSLGCDFHDSYFGASYPDATCIDGYLWDLDSNDTEGLLTIGGDDACPQCNHEEWIDDFKDEVIERGYLAAHDGLPRECPIKTIRFEREGDVAKFRNWWFEGYDQHVLENDQDKEQP